MNKRELLVYIPCGYVPSGEYFRNATIGYARNDTIIVSYSPDYLIELKKYDGLWNVERIINDKMISNNPKYAAWWNHCDKEVKGLGLPGDYYSSPPDDFWVSPDKSKKIADVDDEYFGNEVTVVNRKGKKTIVHVTPCEIDNLAFLDEETIVQLAVPNKDGLEGSCTYGDLRLIFYNINDGTSNALKIEVK